MTMGWIEWYGRSENFYNKLSGDWGFCKKKKRMKIKEPLLNLDIEREKNRDQPLKPSCRYCRQNWKNFLNSVWALSLKRSWRICSIMKIKGSSIFWKLPEVILGTWKIFISSRFLVQSRLIIPLIWPLQSREFYEMDFGVKVYVGVLAPRIVFHRKEYKYNTC